MSVNNDIGEREYARGFMMTVMFFVMFTLLAVFSMEESFLLARIGGVLGMSAVAIYFGLIRMQAWAYQGLLIVSGFSVLATVIAIDQWQPWTSVGTLIFPLLALYVRSFKYSLKLLVGYGSIAALLYGAPGVFGIEGIQTIDQVIMLMGIAVGSLCIGLHKRTLYEDRVFQAQYNMVDKMTGLLNAYGLQRRVSEEMKRSVRDGSCLVLINCNLKEFDTINYQYGKDIGDAVLVYLGNLLKCLCRETDVVGRMDSDDFYIALPGASMMSASQLLDRIVAGFGEGKLVVKGKIVCMKMHVGLAERDKKGCVDELFREAKCSMLKTRQMQLRVKESEIGLA
jgi:diguanylate cyclase (GGDEF)-like protein